jgi:hypothetical protein
MGGANEPDRSPALTVCRCERRGKGDDPALRSRAPRGEGVRESTLAGHWSPLTLLGAMREEGLLATMFGESPTDGDALGAYLG